MTQSRHRPVCQPGLPVRGHLFPGSRGWGLPEYYFFYSKACFGSSFRLWLRRAVCEGECWLRCANNEQFARAHIPNRKLHLRCQPAPPAIPAPSGQRVSYPIQRRIGWRTFLRPDRNWLAGCVRKSLLSRAFSSVCSSAALSNTTDSFARCCRA